MSALFPNKKNRSLHCTTN